MTREEEFMLELYKNAEDEIKEVYREQKTNRDELLTNVALIMLTYTIIDNLMNMTSKDKNKEYDKLSTIIINMAKGQAKTQGKVIKDILGNAVKKTFDFYNYNAKQKDVKKVIDKSFKGKHFSKRVWENEQEVAKKLHKEMDRFLNGKINVNQIKKDIEKTYNVSAYNAKRLVETEVSRCANEAFIRFCEETGVKKVRYNATLDNRTCDDCKQYHDNAYDFGKEIELPRHPLCRCFYTIEDHNIVKINSGALTSKNDPDFKRRDEHAEQYYESVRKRNKKEEVSTIAKNTGLNSKTIEKVYDHVFINKYDLEHGYKSFVPDYDMSQSWQRLREGKNIQEHDLIMLKHERLEYELMNRYNKKYIEAHNLTEKKYNYAKALKEHLKKNNLE